MMRRASLARRLSISLILCIGSVWIMSIAGVTWWVSRAVNENFDHELGEVSCRMLEIAMHELDAGEAQRQPGKALIARPPLISDDAVIFWLADGKGTPLLRESSAPEAGFSAPLVPGLADQGPWRIFTIKHPSRDIYLQVAEPLEERAEAVRYTLWGLIVFMAGVLPLLAALIFAVARRELTAVGTLRREIAGRSGSDLSPVSLDALPAELHAMGEDVNRLLERLSTALHTERALAAHAAHELRTPLAAMRLSLQTALDHGLARSEVEEALASVTKLAQRTEKLLQMARAESASALTAEAVDLQWLAGAVVQEFGSLAGKQSELVLLPPEEGAVRGLGDVDSLGIALRNLIENALLHGSPGQVMVQVVAPATFVVRDSGPGLGPDKLERLRERHLQMNRSAVGHGLGLTIVRAIVDRHAGRLELSSPAGGQGNGFEARIVLPPAPR